MEAAPTPEPSAPGLSALHSSPVVVPGRELRLLMQGLKGWYGRPPGADPEGSLALLVGEAGAGKSLLMEALGGGLRSLGVAHHVAACRREAAPLLPIRRILEAILSDLAAGRFAAAGRGGPSWDDLQPFLPDLQRALPAFPWPERVDPFPRLPHDLDRIRLADNLAGVLACVARAAPLVLGLEDLQWIDPLSRDTLAALLRITLCRAREPEPPRLLVVGTARPVASSRLAEDHPRRLRSFSVELRGYSREDLRDQAALLRVDLPASSREGLLRATGGNPFLIHFCLLGIRSGEERELGALPEDPARFAEFFARRISSRLAALPASERRTLEVLSVLGDPAPLDLLASLLAEEPASLEKVVHRLEAGGWVRREPSAGAADGAGPPGRIIIAGEAIAEALREALGGPASTDLHRRVGEALLEHGGEPSRFPAFRHLSRCAGHPRLLEVGMEAAREAESLGGTLEAIEALERVQEALEPGTDPAIRDPVEEKLAGLLEAAGYDREAIEAYQRLAERLPGPQAERKASLLRRTGDLHGKMGEADLQSRLYRRGLQVLEGAGESVERLKLFAVLARLAMDRGQEDEGRRWMGQAGSPERARLDDPDYLEIHRLAEEVSFRRREYVEALAFEEQIFERCASGGDALGLAVSAEHLGHLLLLKGDRERALHFLRRGLESARALGSRLLAARFLIRIGKLLRGTGDAREALRCLVQARDLFEELGFEETASDLHLSLAHLFLLVHDFQGAAESLREYSSGPARFRGEAARGVFPPVYRDRAQRDRETAHLRQGLAGKGGGPEPPDRAAQLMALADLLLDGGEHGEAGRLYDQALHSGESLRDPVLLAQALQKAGRHHRLQGDRGKALRLLEKSLELLGPDPRKDLVGNAYLETAMILLTQGEPGKAHGCLLRGVRLFLDLEEEEGLIVSFLRLAELLMDSGLGDEARSFAHSAAAMSLRAHRQRWALEAYRLMGAMASEAGDFVESARCFGKARAIVEVLGLPAEAARLQVEVGWEAYRRGQYPVALRIAREGIEAARQHGAQDVLEDFLFLLGAVESALSNKSKNFLRALELLNQALLGAQNRGRPAVESRILLAIARIYRERGKEDLAREVQKRSDSILEGLSARRPLPIREAARRTLRPAAMATSPRR